MGISRTEAASILDDVKESTLARFDDVQDFLNENRLGGWLCRHPDHRYGALVIDTVEGHETDPQRIFGVPKMRYPFGRTEEEERKYHWPKDIVAVRAYEKLDGTSILVYRYLDANGLRFVTAKTRLTPTLRGSSTYGDFLDLWRKAGVHRWAVEFVRDHPFSLAFELYGHLNHHLVTYKEPLVAALLFGVDVSDGAISPPESIAVKCPGCFSVAQLVANWEVGSDLTEFYDKLRAQSEAQNKQIDDDHIEGSEGSILYVRTPEGWSQWKAKPESIEALHWQGDMLPISVILPTAWNALESVELVDSFGIPLLTVAIVAELLEEEFSTKLIVASTRRVESCVARVLERLQWRQKVEREYLVAGANWEADGKGTVMRLLSEVFAKGEMRNVYNALRELGIAKEEG